MVGVEPGCQLGLHVVLAGAPVETGLAVVGQTPVEGGMARQFPSQLQLRLLIRQALQRQSISK